MSILAPSYTRIGNGTLLLCFVKHHAMKHYLGGWGEGSGGVTSLRIPKLLLP